MGSARRNQWWRWGCFRDDRGRYNRRSSGIFPKRRSATSRSQTTVFIKIGRRDRGRPRLVRTVMEHYDAIAIKIIEFCQVVISQRAAAAFGAGVEHAANPFGMRRDAVDCGQFGMLCRQINGNPPALNTAIRVRGGDQFALFFEVNILRRRIAPKLCQDIRLAGFSDRRHRRRRHNRHRAAIALFHQEFRRTRHHTCRGAGLFLCQK